MKNFMETFTKFLALFFSGCLMSLFLILIFGWVVMLLWNWTLPNIIDGIHEINIWEAYGIMILCNILFKNHVNVKS